MSDLSQRNTWTGTSPEGLAFEIAHWGVGNMCDGKGMWNYYVIIHEDQLRPEDWEKVWLPVANHWHRSNGHDEPSYDTWGSVLEGGDFHGGITFYEKYAQVDGTRRWIRVGCDYGHLWDSEIGYSYSLDRVKADALRTCRELADLLNPLVRCGYTGQFFDPRFDVGADVPGWKGKFLSPAGLGSRSMWSRKNAVRKLREAA
ncbi:hypothetical protein [Nitratireductor basaltis]|uniref:Uncharacterized protein n=1 Tax=Nitratireductor basaltis TaxID=472175 RepID=A0A084UBN4_9HYPH|nr:hypothetical protein [Nitratireductor basaltis]KFB10370.1 hypothetical protein EL18_01401 [Nitratireductor basaltis]